MTFSYLFFTFQVKKETQQLREFEEGLVSQFKFYLENLEQTTKGNVRLWPHGALNTYTLMDVLWSCVCSSHTTDWKQKKLKSSQAVALASYKGLAEVAIRCLCELLVALPYFNFHNNIIVAVVALMNEPSKKASQTACF